MLCDQYLAHVVVLDLRPGSARRHTATGCTSAGCTPFVERIPVGDPMVRQAQRFVNSVYGDRIGMTVEENGRTG